jgi:hypothetical protein
MLEQKYVTDGNCSSSSVTGEYRPFVRGDLRAFDLAAIC